MNNLPAGYTSVTVKVVFQKMPKGTTTWSNIGTVNQIAGTGNGTVNIDTGWQNLAPAPASGDQYRIAVSGSWSNTGPPVTSGDLTAIASAPITPVP